jgi:hypothetical protein
MTKTSLIIQRDLKAEGDFRAFNEEIEKIMTPFGARFIGCGTLMTSMTRDWEYEVDIGSAHIVAEKLKDAGYSVDLEDDYFGLCPICHKTDGYANAGRSHRFFCKEHKTSWCIGSNIFSDWRHQTEEEQRRIWNEIGLADFQDVKPYSHPRQHQDDIFPHLVRDFPDEDECPF